MFQAKRGFMSICSIASLWSGVAVTGEGSDLHRHVMMHHEQVAVLKDTAGLEIALMTVVRPRP